MRASHALSTTTAVFITLAALGSAAADDQSVRANLKLSGFNNNNVSVGFKSSDIFDGYHSCNAGSGSGCTASNGYGSPPKNIGNVLCMPNSLVYSITSSCQAILSSGSSQGCKKNSAIGFCGSNATVSAYCDWRTNNNKNDVNWNWSVAYNNGSFSVDCSNSNYQGYTE